ncbi:MAG: hypothetical protein H6573_28100 [Lewinellaceae bacterium]|nr:hypothetical protein [Phaeodactylibacter sp.]MCB0614740.1 hypothetical protein [Phaeodactylibacter sp.]MCB9351332.1 hypothetical protein [Lewinellaceae bacterium]
MAKNAETSQEQQSDQPNVDPIDQVFLDFANGLKDDEIKQNSTDVIARRSALAIARNVEAGRKNTWEQANRANGEYQAIREHVVLELLQANTEMKGNFGDAKTLLETLNTQLETAVGSVKNAHKKMLAVLEALNNLDKVIKDHCNKSEFKALDGQVGLKSKVDGINQKAEAAYQNVCKYFDTAVKMAGVKAQLNLDPVDTKVRLIDTRITDFSAKVEEALTAAVSQRDATRQAFDDAIKDRVTKEDDMNVADMVHRIAYILIYNWSLNPQSRRVRWTIDEIVEQVESNYANPVPSDNDDDDN